MNLRQRGLDVAPPDEVQVRREVGHGRGEEPGMARVRIGTAYESDFRHVVGGSHPRVGRMELIRVTFGLQEAVDAVDAVGDHQERSGGLLGQEVPQRPTQAAGQAHTLALARDERERAVDVEHCGRVVREQAPTRLVDRHVEDVLVLVRDEIRDPVNRASRKGAECHEESLSTRSYQSERRWPAGRCLLGS